jgi:hypothetical protein
LMVSFFTWTTSIGKILSMVNLCKGHHSNGLVFYV